MAVSEKNDQMGVSSSYTETTALLLMLEKTLESVVCKYDSMTQYVTMCVKGPDEWDW